MNHLTAMQRVSDGRWDYTYNGTPWGYCREFQPFTECSWMSQEWADKENAKQQPFLGKFHTDGHATAEEACECYKQYLLDLNLRLALEDPANPQQLNRCQICGTFTARHAFVGSYNVFVLCPEHQTRESVESLLRVGESWES